jgi:uncharacterized SAM-binding protein YcdF (DUF218 family)
MDVLFLFKKIVGPLFFPLSICLILLVLGLIFLWFSRRERTGKVLVTIGVVLLALLSYSAFSDKLLGPLEYKYPPVLNAAGFNDVKWVVVMGSGHNSDPRLPVTSQIVESAAVRLLEGVRLHRMLPESKLVLSGGPVFDPVPHAQVLADVAAAIGVDSQHIVLETRSGDTKDEARFIQDIVGDERFLLVTSASHMPRSMAMFKKLGMNPIPAPTDHSVKEKQACSPSMFFPRAGNLEKAERAVYEYVGLMWAKLRGQV